uniref:FTH domain-containing protein n=2 Tax=Caenorhabditis tropicalis TaxID=1561998 RepID=A0A1I7TS54_9PELO
MSENIGKSSNNLDEEFAKKCKVDESSDHGEFEKWSVLPAEMKLAVIERMDLRPKMMLRRTSKTEKAIVDSLKKYELDTVTFRDEMIHVNGRNDMDTIVIRKKNRTDEEYSDVITSFFEQILKKSEVRLMNIHHFTLRCLERLDTIIKPRSLRIHEMSIEGSLKWSTQELEIGSKISNLMQQEIGFYLFPSGYRKCDTLMFRDLCIQLAHRKISLTNRYTLRLTTNNPHKHMIIYFGYNEPSEDTSLSGVVISADVSESSVHEYLDFLPLGYPRY